MVGPANELTRNRMVSCLVGNKYDPRAIERGLCYVLRKGKVRNGMELFL